MARAPAICGNEELAWVLAKTLSSMFSGKTLVSEHGGFHDILLASSGLDSLYMISLMHFTSTKYHVRRPASADLAVSFDDRFGNSYCTD